MTIAIKVRKGMTLVAKDGRPTTVQRVERNSITNRVHIITAQGVLTYHAEDPVKVAG
jgi:hypothetical protein